MKMAKKQSMKKRIEKFEQKQKSLQEERNARLIELKRVGDKEALAREVRLMNKRINERFRQIEKRHEKPQNTTAYRYAMQELGQEKPRYTESLNKIMHEDIDRLYEKALGGSQKLASKSASLSGINYIEEKRVSGAIRGIKEQLGIDIEDTPEFRKFLKENANEMIDNNVGSDVIFEMFSMALHKENGVQILVDKWQEEVSRGERIDTIAMKKWLK